MDYSISKVNEILNIEKEEKNVFESFADLNIKSDFAEIINYIADKVEFIKKNT